MAGAALLPSLNRADLLSSTTTLPVGSATVVALLLLGAGVVRSALVPMQSWLPETSAAPSPVSALLHAGVVNGAGILGALAWPIFAAAPAVLLMLIVVGAASVAIGTWTARVRTDVKGQLAASTTAQMGYMGVQLGLGLPAAAVAHLIGHGYYKAWPFLRAGGAVTRQRALPVVNSVRTRFGTPEVFVMSGIVLAVGVTAAAPAIVESANTLGLTSLLPFMLALVAAVVGVAAMAASGRFSTGQQLIVAMVACALAATYQWLLLAWERLLSGTLPEAVLWEPVVAIVLLVGILATGTGSPWFRCACSAATNRYCRLAWPSPLSPRLPAHCAIRARGSMADPGHGRVG